MFEALLWKEWREQRAILLAGISLAGALPLLLLVTVLSTGESAADLDLPRSFTWVCLTLLWPFAAIVAGAATIAGEKAQNTLSFLFVRPVSRARVWLAKVVVAAGVVGAIVVASLFVAEIAAQILLGSSFGNPLDMLLDATETQSIGFFWFFVSSNLMVLFSVSVLASTLVKQSLYAVGLGLVGGGFVVVLLLSPMLYHGGHPLYTEPWVLIEMVLLSALLLTVSLYLFARGDLRGVAGRRLKRALALLGSVLVVAMVVAPYPWLVPRLTVSNAFIFGVAPDAVGEHLVMDVATWDGRSPQVWLLNATGGPAVPLTSSGAWWASLSPDGEVIAYLRSGWLTSRTDLRLMSLDGSRDRVLLKDLPGTSRPTDVFYTEDSAGTIKFSPAGEQVALVHGDHLIVAPTDVTPDGPDAIVFELQSSPFLQTKVVGWTPDSQDVILLTRTNETERVGSVARVEVFRVADQSLRLIAALDRTAATPARWNPSAGARLVPIMQFESSQFDAPGWFEGTPIAELLLIDVVSGDRTTVTRRLITDAVDLDEKNDRLAYATWPLDRENGTDKIHIRDLATGEDLVKVAVDDGPRALFLSPDGSRAIWQGYPGLTAGDSYLVDLDGNVTRVFSELGPIAWLEPDRVLLADALPLTARVAAGNPLTGEVEMLYELHREAAAEMAPWLLE